MECEYGKFGDDSKKDGAPLFSHLAPPNISPATTCSTQHLEEPPMTRRLLVLGLTLAALTGFASVSQAHGFRHRCAPAATCGGGCGATAAPCAPVAVAPAPPPVQYVEKQVTTYKTDWVTKTVPVQVRKMVQKTVNEQFTYNVQVPITTPKTIQQTYYEQVMVNQPYTYTVQVPVVTPKTVQQTYCEQVMVNQPYTYMV